MYGLPLNSSGLQSVLTMPPHKEHSGLPEPYASERARLWLHWPQHPFMCHLLPHMVKQLRTSQKYNHPLASSI